MPKRSGQTVNRADMAAIIGVVPNTITEWVRRGCPVLERGSHGREYQFDTAAVIQWRMDCLQAEMMERDGAAPDFDRDRARKMQADADLAEIERDLARGRVIERREVLDAVTSEYATVRSRLGSLPGLIAPRVDPVRAVEVQGIVAGIVDDVLQELSADGKWPADNEPEKSAEEGKGAGAKAGSAPQPD
jgi:phage terminase Nu1 subunit (DNA packaging protein)